MPFVGKDLKTLEFKRQRHLKELEQKSKNRIYFKKNKEHTKDTGSSLIAGRPQKTTLEEYLDKSKMDINIENFLIKEMGVNVGQAKIFIQGLDDSLKSFLIDRLPSFQKIFSENFSIPTANNLKSAFELFNLSQLEKLKDVDVPTRKDITDYLEDLYIDRIYELGVSVFQEQQKKVRGTPPAEAMRLFDLEYDNIIDTAGEDFDDAIVSYVATVIIAFVRTFENPLDGWMITYQIAKNMGLRDFPKPNVEDKRGGVPTTHIRTPLSSMDLGSNSDDYTIESPRSPFESDDSTGFDDSTIDSPRTPPGRNPNPPPDFVRRRRRELLEGTGAFSRRAQIYRLRK